MPLQPYRYLASFTPEQWERWHSQGLRGVGNRPHVSSPIGAYTLLHWAVNQAQGGDVSVVEDMLAAGLSGHQKNAQNHTVLMTACDHAPAAVPVLLEAGARVNTHQRASGNYTRFTALFHAAHAPTVAALVSAGARLEHALADGTTALIRATELGRPGVVEALVASGANLEAQDILLETAVWKAVRHSTVRCLATLVAHGAVVDMERRNLAGSSLPAIARPECKRWLHRWNRARTAQEALSDALPSPPAAVPRRRM